MPGKLAARQARTADRLASASDSNRYKKVIKTFCAKEKAGERRIALMIEKGHFTNPAAMQVAKLPPTAKKNKDMSSATSS